MVKSARSQYRCVKKEPREKRIFFCVFYHFADAGKMMLPGAMLNLPKISPHRQPRPPQKNRAPAQGCTKSTAQSSQAVDFYAVSLLYAPRIYLSVSAR